MSTTEEKAFLTYQNMDSDTRNYILDEDVALSFRQYYKYIHPDVKLARVIDGGVGTESDTYILYAIALLGIAEVSVIATLLHRMQIWNRNLPISDFVSDKNYDTLKYRLKLLLDSGFLVRHSYQVTSRMEKYNMATHVSLYSVCDDAITFINQRLGKGLKINRWFNAKAKQELIGLASCSFVASKFFFQEEFRKLDMYDFRNKLTNQANFMPVDMRMQRDEKEYSVGIIPSFLKETDVDYEEQLKAKLRLLWGYFETKNGQNVPCNVIVSVKDARDLNLFANGLAHSDLLEKYLPCIYFTGEGAMRLGGTELEPLSDYFLCVKKDGRKKLGYSLYTPDSMFK